jgi:hypothetical protein
MEEASWRRHHGAGITEEGGIMEVASWRHLRDIWILGGIWEASREEASGRRRQHRGRHHRGGDIMEKAYGGGIMEEASWRRHHGGGRLHGGGILEASWKHQGDIWEASGRHLGCIWEASGRLLEASGRRMGALRRSGVSWGVSAHKCSPLYVCLRFFAKSFKKQPGVLKVGVSKYCVWQQI